MSFLEPLLLALAAFAALPVLLHLIRRRRVRVLELPTFRFLKKAAMQQRFHLRIQDQLLMILRILVLLLLALAFAGPSTHTGSSPETPHLGVENILLLDDSPSMEVRGREGQSLFEHAAGIARAALESHRGNWRVILAGEALRGEDPLAGAASDRMTFEEQLASRSPGGFTEPIETVLERVAADIRTGGALWLLSDRTASNWTLTETARALTLPVHLLLVGDPWDGTNWAISNFSVRNEPLFENEPALLAVSAESFSSATGAKSNPSRLRYGWVDRQGNPLSSEMPVSATGNAPRALGTASVVPSGVRSVTAALVFPPGEGDSLPLDNQHIRIPKTLTGARVQVLAADPEWRRLLQAALSGFETEGADPGQPPPGGDSPRSATVLLLGENPPAPEWTRLLRARVEGGEGLLVFQGDATADTLTQAHSDWWDAWQSGGRGSRAPAGAITLIAGENPWFDSALDSGARATVWAEKGFRAFPLTRWTNEWLARTELGEELPLFQTQQFGAGTVGVWTVPLSPSETSLVLSPGWVPLLSQMVKRTLIHPDSIAETAPLGVPLRESDLRSLSAEQERVLAGRGIHALDADQFIGEIENLPSTLHDWTAAILALCFLLALLELGVSNSV